MNAPPWPSFTDVWSFGYRDLVPVEPRDKAVLLKGWQYHVPTRPTSRHGSSRESRSASAPARATAARKCWSPSTPMRWAN